MKRLMLEGPDWDGDWVDQPEGDDVFDDAAWEKCKWVEHKGLRELLKISVERPSAGYGGDEYGNPSVYLRTGLFGIVFFYGRYIQQDVELPEFGECTWADRVYYREAAS